MTGLPDILVVRRRTGQVSVVTAPEASVCILDELGRSNIRGVTDINHVCHPGAIAEFLRGTRKVELSTSPGAGDRVRARRRTWWKSWRRR